MLGGAFLAWILACLSSKSSFCRCCSELVLKLTRSYKKKGTNNEMKNNIKMIWHMIYNIYMTGEYLGAKVIRGD